MPTGEFAHKIIVKDNAAEILDKELSREGWNRRWTVNLSTVTDPYQPAERQFRITRDVLKVFLRHHNALMVTTKSDLIVRDLDILSEMAQTGFLNVVLTIPAMDEDLRRKVEPNAPSISRRVGILNELHSAGVTVGVAAIPLFPYISDGEDDLGRLIKTFAENGADYVIVDLLNFREEARGRFMEFIRNNYPDLAPKYEELYTTNYCDKGYAKQIRNYANKLIKEYKVGNYDKMFSYRKGV